MGDAARTLISHMEEVDCLLFHIEWGSNHTHIELIDSRADPNSERPVVTIDLISLPITRGVGFRILYGSSKSLAWLRYLLKPIDRIGNSGVARLRSIGHVTKPLLLVTEGCSDEELSESTRSLETLLGLPEHHLERVRTRWDSYTVRLRGRPALRTHEDLIIRPPVGAEYSIGFNHRGLLLLVPHPGGWLHEHHS